MKWIKFGYVLYFGFITNVFAQNITVDDTYSAQQLVQNVLVNSSCANVSNFSISGGAFGTGENSYGYFNAGTSGFPLANGVVLSTCRANYVPGPNSSILSDNAPDWLGDSDLAQALNISNISNATILEFDFVPLTSTFSFDYIFASEEYHDTASCTYSDGFAFLLKVAGSSDPYQNLALVPNTTTPVKVTTVHPDIPGGCGPQNEAYFGSFNSVNSPTNFNGQTVVMTALGNVIPGTTYHIKLVIADETNPQYDSAIFLGGNSFNIGVNIGPDKLIATGNPICQGETIVLNGTVSGSNTYQWFKDGFPLLGETNSTYTVSSAGSYKVEVILSGTVCTTTGEVVIEYSPLPTLNPTTIVQCDENNDGISTFDLTKVYSIITGGNLQLSTASFYKNLADAQAQTNLISNPTTYQNTTTNQVIARITNSFGCANYATINLVISNNTINNQTYTSCDVIAPQDGFTLFNLNSITPQILLGLPSGLVVQYYATSNDAILEINPLPNNFTNTIANQQIIYARVINGADCYGIVPITLLVKTFSPIGFADETLYLCNGDSIALSVPSNFSSYLWSDGTTSHSILVSNAALYTVTVTNSDGCSITKNFTVLASELAILDEVIVNDFSDENNSIQININGSGVYEYSLDGFNYQSENIFLNVIPNQYTIYIRDKNGCGTLITSAVVLNYPKYFTPNNDGYNDIWEIKNLSYFPNSQVTVFDRYGKLIYSFNENQKGWDGTLNEKQLLATDYWFNIQFANGRNVKGHFSMKR
ncbi:MAG: choice-of-anchor L domain-containing protein [Flavobacteriaceae bacterium]|nr:choice-of-anchor L domain-containing protein [Flavobacteriaceae bacterium]